MSGDILILILFVIGFTPATVALYNLFFNTNLKSFSSFEMTKISKLRKKVSILIPARNEAKNLENLIKSLKEISYPDFEVLILDDNSTDGTYEKAVKLTENDKQFKILKGKDLPAGWVGKNFACSQLVESADGDNFLFIDADVILSPYAVEKAFGNLAALNLDALSVFPSQKMKTFGEFLIVPLMQWFLLSFLPLNFVRIFKSGAFTAANGQFILFKKEAYFKIGGHEKVKNCVVEDMELAKNIKKSGMKFAVFTGGSDISCRMYSGFSDALQGFSKNFYAGFNKKTAAFFILHIFVQLITTLLTILSFAVSNYFLLVPQIVNRIAISAITKQNIFYNTLLHPIQMLMFMVVGVNSFIQFKTKKSRWKKRELNSI